MADTISEVALEWAQTHIEKYNDTDLFPRAFEIDAIRHNWKSIRDNLKSAELGDYKPESTFRILVTKSDHGFRVALQLGPLDTLMYVGAVYELADQIENHRVSQAARIACSYRVELKPNGSLFRESDGSDDFHSRSKELAKSTDYTHVLTADIADFYNQIYTHRIQSFLESAGVAPERAGNLEAFLLKLTAKQSRGIPVGPYASNLLAEGCLDDVDKRLMGKGIAHTRYVDDFRLFCKSRKEAYHALHDLTEYLYTAHRLTLQLGKTKVLTVEQFLQGELHDPEEKEESKKKSSIQRMLSELRNTVGYGANVDDIDKKELNESVRKDLLGLFQECVSADALQQNLARYLLRRATALRTRALYQTIFDNLEKLVPVFRDVCIYIRKTLSFDQAPKWGPALRAFLQSNDLGSLPYVQLWGLYLLEEIPSLATAVEALNIAEKSERALGIRQTALLAKAHNQTDWIRTYKENWSNHGPRDRRAIIWAGTALPQTEMNKWLELVKESGDLLDCSVAQFTLNMKSAQAAKAAARATKKVSPKKK